MTFAVLFTPKAVRSLKKLSRTMGPRLLESLRGLETSPELGEKLKPSKFWKIRVGDHRVIYEIDGPGSRVVVLFIGHRKNVYDEFERLL